MLITSSAIKVLNLGFIAMPCMLSGAVKKDANIAKAGAFFSAYVACARQRIARF
jgi:hypothetical protein